MILMNVWRQEPSVQKVYSCLEAGAKCTESILMFGGRSQVYRKYTHVWRQEPSVQKLYSCLEAGAKGTEIIIMFGGRSQGYRNSRRVIINRLEQQLCKEEKGGFVDLWDYFVAKEDM